MLDRDLLHSVPQFQLSVLRNTSVLKVQFPTRVEGCLCVAGLGGDEFLYFSWTLVYSLKVKSLGVGPEG